MPYSVVNVDELAYGVNWFDSETTRQPVPGPDGLTFVSIGARRGSYEPRGPF